MSRELRKCKVCGEEKPLVSFPKTQSETSFDENGNKRKYRKHTCWTCYKNNPQRKEKHRRNVREYNKRIKTLILNHYGGKCTCCGETEVMFLTLDHVDGGGNEHRRELGCSSGSNFYKWVVRNGFPDNLQILCANCNLGKHSNGGICPHQFKLKLVSGGGLQ